MHLFVCHSLCASFCCSAATSPQPQEKRRPTAPVHDLCPRSNGQYERTPSFPRRAPVKQSSALHSSRAVHRRNSFWAASLRALRCSARGTGGPTEQLGTGTADKALLPGIRPLQALASERGEPPLPAFSCCERILCSAGRFAAAADRHA